MKHMYSISSRLLTALIGLVTAGLVNFIILPPKYYHQLEEQLALSEKKMYNLFYVRCNELLLGKFSSEKTSKELSKLNIIAQKLKH